MTVEGLAEDGELHPCRRPSSTTGAVQCGFCTPGLVVATAALLERIPEPSDDEIREALSGNLCRCTGYQKIFDAVRAAAGLGREGHPMPPPAFERSEHLRADGAQPCQDRANRRR